MLGEDQDTRSKLEPLGTRNRDRTTLPHILHAAVIYSFCAVRDSGGLLSACVHLRSGTALKFLSGPILPSPCVRPENGVLFRPRFDRRRACKVDLFTVSLQRLESDTNFVAAFSIIEFYGNLSFSKKPFASLLGWGTRT